MDVKPKRKSNNPFGRPMRSDKPLQNANFRVHPDLVDEFKILFRVWHDSKIDEMNQGELVEYLSKGK